MSLSKNLSFVLLGEDRSASSTMTHTQDVAERVTSRIGGSFSKLGGMIGGEFGEVLNRVGDGIETVGGKTRNTASVLGAAGGVVTGLGLALQQAGSADKQAADQLQQAIKTTGGSYSDYREKIEKTIATQENYGHGAADTQQALQKMTTAFGDPKKALDAVGIAANLAASKHINLADAADLVVRIAAGKGAKTLSQYGIVMEKSSGSAKQLTAAHTGVEKATTTLSKAQERLTQLQEIDHGKKKLTIADHIALENAQQKVAEASAGVTTAQTRLSAAEEAAKHPTDAAHDALEKLAGKLNGQAGASMNNFGAQVNATRVKLGDWISDVGQHFGPALTVMGPVLMGVAAAMEIWKVASIGAKLATIGSTVATGIATAAQWAWNVALDANPIGIVIVAIAALVAGLVWFFTQTKLGKEVWTNVTQAIGVAVNWMWNSVIHPVFTAVGAAWNWLTGSIVNAGTWIQDAVNNIGHAFSTVFGAIGGTVRDAFNGVLGFIQNGINGAIGLINGMIGAVNTVGGGVGIHIGLIPHVSLPHFAGGTSNAPGGLAVVGEKGPEVVRLPAGSQVYPNGTGPKQQGGLHIEHFHAASPTQSPAEIAAELGWQMRWAT